MMGLGSSPRLRNLGTQWALGATGAATEVVAMAGAMVGGGAAGATDSTTSTGSAATGAATAVGSLAASMAGAATAGPFCSTLVVGSRRVPGSKSTYEFCGQGTHQEHLSLSHWDLFFSGHFDCLECMKL